MDELVNIPTKAEERSMIQISFRTQNPNRRPAQSGTVSKITADPRSTVFSKSANLLDLPQKSTIRALFKVARLDFLAGIPPKFERQLCGRE